ncbi:MAG: hypothetical protein U0805_13415 [Pirellulales bacterium]
MTDSELLNGVSIDELDALAAGVLIPSAQAHLDELLAKSKEYQASPAEERELEHLLRQVDFLNLLKARALYTIQRLGTKASNA